MVVLAVVVGFQAVVTLAAAAGLIIYGSRWIERRQEADREFTREMVDKFLDAVGSVQEQASIERDRLAERIQSPLAPHVQAMQQAMPPPQPQSPEEAFKPYEPDFDDPNLDMDLLIASQRNGEPE